MSEQDNIQVVQQLYQAMGAGDVPAMMALAAEDGVLVSPGPADLVPWAGEYHGPEGLMQYIVAVGQGLERSGMELDKIVAQGDTVVAIGRHTAKVQATGKSYDLEWAHVFTVRGGKIAATRMYHDTYLVAEAARPD